MENKIAVSTLSSLLAQSTGKSKKLSEDFLREFFKLVSECLVEGDPIKIKGLGTFKIQEVESRVSVNIQTGEPLEIGQHKKVTFTPSKELAALINAPFEEFESVEIDDDMPEEYFYGEQEVEGEENLSNENLVKEPILEAGSIEEGEDDEITYEAYNQIESELLEETPYKDSDKIGSTVPAVIPVYNYPEPTKSRFGIGFLTGALSVLVVCVIVFMIGCFLDWWPINFKSAKELFSNQIENSKNSNQEVQDMTELTPEQIETEPIIPEPEPVYDTVSTTRYLTTIARDHYGNFNFWPYIYLENENILGHPDRITPGTKVVVPDLKKYGVDPSNQEDAETAKRLALDIYARFK